MYTTVAIDLRFTHRSAPAAHQWLTVLRTLRHKLCLTVTIITAVSLLTLSCEHLISAEVFSSPLSVISTPSLWKDLCLFLMSHSRKIIVASTLFGVFYLYIISMYSGINSTYRNNHLRASFSAHHLATVTASFMPDSTEHQNMP